MKLNAGLAHCPRMNSVWQPQAQNTAENPAAVDLWIKRILRERFGQVAREPIPEELLRMLDKGPAEH